MALLGHNELTQWGLDKMEAIVQTTYWNTFYWMKSLDFEKIKITSEFTPLRPNRMAWQWAETLVEIRGTLADIRGTTK